MNHIKFKDLKNRYLDRTVFVLGNSPSILNHDLSKLRDQLVIGINSSILLEKKFNFKAHFHCISDKRFFSSALKSEIVSNILNNDSIKVIRRDIYDKKISSKNILLINSLGRDGFSFDLNQGFYFGSTTTMLAIQLASWIGCQKIALLGCDFFYLEDNQRFFKETIAAPNDPMISVQIKNIFNASKALQQRGVSTFVCSKKSFLRPYIPYEKYESLLKEENEKFK